MIEIAYRTSDIVVWFKGEGDDWLEEDSFSLYGLDMASESLMDLGRLTTKQRVNQCLAHVSISLDIFDCVVIQTYHRL